MVRPRVRRKLRNPNAKVSRRPKDRRHVSFAGAHPLVAKSWDRNKTLRQNYEAMGLVVSLKGHAGGTGVEAAKRKEELEHFQKLRNNVEWRVIDTKKAAEGKDQDNDDGDDDDDDEMFEEDDAAEDDDQDTEQNKPLIDFTPLEAHIKVDQRAKRIGSRLSSRNPIVPVPATADANADTETAKPVNPVIAAMEASALNAYHRDHHASDHERSIFSKMVDKYGDDYEAMSRDLKLNKYQFSAGQIRKKVKSLSFKK
eukprot:jgi/Hompol1/673/HPOL_000985-RA